MRSELQAALSPRYRLDRELGRGGMATVFLAHDTRYDRPVAIKVLHPHLAPTIGSARFLREIRVAAQLTHPHIVTVHDSGEADGTPFYVMPYVEGESLRHRLERERQLPPDVVLELTRQIAGALQFAHERGVVHRDVKPENILLAGAHAWIADFGIARAAEVAGGGRLTETGVSLGTPAYMSPEQAAGEADLDGRSDVYALGCVVYEMLAGTPPFTGATAAAILARQVVDPVPPLATVRPGLPPEVIQAVTRALAKAPADRFPTMEAFAGALVRPAAEAAVPERSIVVLPFGNLSPDPDNEYFADGLTEDVITDLSKIGSLRVISRNSAMQLKGTTKDTRTIGRELEVGYVLEGTVRRAGSSLRVTAQLIDAARDAHVWAERFSGTVDDVFEIQERLARRIVEALQVALTPKEVERLRERPLGDVRALDCYHRARQEMYRFTIDGFERARRLLETGIELVGENAFLRAAQAQACLLAMGGMVLVTREMLCRAEEYADSAERLDATLPEVKFVRASLALQRGELETAARLFRNVVQVRPGNADAVLNLAVTYAFLGKNEPAMPLIDEAQRLDPLTSVIHAVRSFAIWSTGDFAAAVEHNARFRALEPESPFARLLMMLMCAFMGRIDQAHQEAAELAAMAPDSMPARLGMFWSYGLRGERERAQALITAEVIQAAECDVQVIAFLTWGYGMLGEVEETLRWTARTVELGGFTSRFWKALPFMRHLHGEPRFEALMDQLDRRSAAFDI